MADHRNDAIKLFVTQGINLVMNIITQNVTWKEYVPPSVSNKIDEIKEPKCNICYIKIVKGDRIPIVDCVHLFHHDCLYRYSDRVESKCPICGIDIKTKFSDVTEINNHPLYKRKMQEIAANWMPIRTAKDVTSTLSPNPTTSNSVPSIFSSSNLPINPTSSNSDLDESPTGSNLPMGPTTSSSVLSEDSTNGNSSLSNPFVDPNILNNKRSERAFNELMYR